MLKRVGGFHEAADKSLQLWALPPSGGPKSLGVLGGEPVVRLTAAEGQVREVPALAISLEPKGGVPGEGGPTGPVLFKGALLQTGSDAGGWQLNASGGGGRRGSSRANSPGSTRSPDRCVIRAVVRRRVGGLIPPIGRHSHYARFNEGRALLDRCLHDGLLLLVNVLRR